MFPFRSSQTLRWDKYPEYQALVLAALYAICTAATPLLARHTPAFYAFIFPTLVPITVRLAFEGGSVATFLALISALVLYGIVVFGRELNHTIRLALARNYENLELVDELRAQKADADRARQEADTANLSKTRFLAAASHDLRQPLHALGLFAAALRSKVKGGEADGIASQIASSVEALENQFTALLDISKLDAGVIKPEIADFPVDEIFGRIEQAFGPTAQEKGLRLRVRPCRRGAHSDPVLVERVLANLVTNAVRYTRRGGVLVACRSRHGGLSVEVWDTGIGIPEEQQEKVFEEFYQVGNVERDRRKGLGLGLATVRRIAQLLETEISVRSRVGRGTVFALRLAESRAVPAPARPPRLVATGAVNRSDLLVVAVDDEPDIREAIRLLLSQWGWGVITGEDADEVLDKLPAFDRYPDLILADYRLRGGKTGLQVIERMRRELGIDIPACLITGTTTPEALKEIEQSGLPLLYKPVTAERLREAIQAAAPRTMWTNP